MTLAKEDRNELIKYRLLQARECIDEVDFQIENRKFKTAINRIYYGMFYSMTALSLKYNFQSSKHLQLIGWFNKTFIKGNIILPKYGKMLRDAFKNRTDGDYAPYIEFKKENVLKLYSDMKAFINEVEKLL